MERRFVLAKFSSGTNLADSGSDCRHAAMLGGQRGVFELAEKSLESYGFLEVGSECLTCSFETR